MSRQQRTNKGRSLGITLETRFHPRIKAKTAPLYYCDVVLRKAERFIKTLGLMIIPAFEPQTKISPFDPLDKRILSVRCCDLQDTPGELPLTPEL